MVKPLEELSLTFISRNFKSFPRLGGRISARHKAMLLERMCWHGIILKIHSSIILCLYIKYYILYVCVCVLCVSVLLNAQ